ncbi:MAG TPA: hypothetical protein VFQ53_11310 [Kofleriaceae bacterium]|nr:hypothetical protein [Kofleriaceae bacterium]
MNGNTGPRPGARIGDYTLVRELPARLTVLAFVAEHTMLPRAARLVVVHPAFANHPAASVQMMREACIVEALAHPAVPRLYECGLTPDRRPWMAIEIIDGPTIEELAAEAPLSVGDVLAVLRDIAAILEHAHGRGVIHRGVRPDAIAVGEHGLQLTDWGDAVIADTLASPGEPLDGRGDIFALGVVAHQVLAPDQRRGPHANAGLVALIDRMLARVPGDRPTAAEVRAEADDLIDELLFPPPPVLAMTTMPAANDDDLDVPMEEVRLVDISRDPPPVPRSIKWTPSPIEGVPVAIAPETSTPRRKT